MGKACRMLAVRGEKLVDPRLIINLGRVGLAEGDSLFEEPLLDLFEEVRSLCYKLLEEQRLPIFGSLVPAGQTDRTSRQIAGADFNP
jgi:hypothetical protein